MIKINKINRLIARLECGSLYDEDIKYLDEIKKAGNLSKFLNKCAACGFVNAIENIFHLDAKCLDSEDDLGRTPLHCAAKHGHLVTLNRLLDWGADGRKKTKSGNNLFHMIAKRSSSPVNFTLVNVSTTKKNKQQEVICAEDNSDDESDEDEIEDDDEESVAVNPVLESVYGIKEYLRRSLKSKCFNSQTVELDDFKKKGGNKATCDVNKNWSASLREVNESSKPVIESCSDGSKEERNFEEWKREIFEDGALERAEVPNSSDLLEYTLRRISTFCDINEKNAAGKTPEEVAIEYENIPVADALRRLNGRKVQESRFQRITKSISKMVDRSPSTDYIVMLREVIDSKQRVPVYNS